MLHAVTWQSETYSAHNRLATVKRESSATTQTNPPTILLENFLPTPGASAQHMREEMEVKGGH